MENVGSISYDARIETSNFSKDADAVERRAGQVASNIEQSGQRSFGNFADQASMSFGSIADGLARIGRAALVVGLSGSVGIGAMAKASWDQVSAVQQSTIALSAYEKDAGKVTDTLSQLVAYARSDLGVLFNRKDLFQSAQNLKLYGDNTADLVGHVKILSRSVGLGLSTWEGLNNVIGRVGSTGRLYADDLQYLQNAGFKLDGSLSGTTQSFDSLFKLLDKGIPADALAGQANTIVGMNVRLQTAFRNVGDAILGVDRDTGKFVNGGLGSRLVALMGTLTAMLKDPELKANFASFGKSVGDFAEKALPLVISGFTWIVNNMGTVSSLIGGLAAAFVVAKVAAIGFSIAASANPIGLLAIAITVLVGVLTFLELKFGAVSNAMRFIAPVIQFVVGIFSTLFSILATQLAPAFDWVSRNADALKRVGLVLLAVALIPLAAGLTVLVGGFALVVGAIIGVVAAFQRIYREAQAVVGLFGGLPGRIVGALGNVGGLLVSAGASLIQGFINGITSKIGAVKNTLGDLTSKLTSWKGPESKDKVILQHSGELVIGGFIKGIESMYGSVHRSLGGLTNSLGMPDISSPSAGMGSLNALDSPGASSTASGGVTVQVSMQGIMSRSKADERDIAKNLIKRVNDELRAKNVAPIGGGALA